MTTDTLRRLPRWGDIPVPWLTVVTLFVASVSMSDGAVVLIGIALAVAVAVICLTSREREGGVPSGPPSGHEPGQRSRGAYRRSFMPNGAGRPRRPRAPGHVASAA